MVPTQLSPLPLRSLHIVTPVYNDWASFRMLLAALDQMAGALPIRIMISAVDDGSNEPADGVLEAALRLEAIERVEIVRLWTNAGHQRAIAIGLCAVCEDADADAVLVMDADGEDPPGAIPHLLQRAEGRGDFCIVAARRKRHETLSFRIGYMLYKLCFKLVTGREIGFGNFSMFSAGYLRRLVMISDLWNNLPAAVLRSRLPRQEVLVDRGTRYDGRSKMNFTSLIVHGFSAIAVYADTIFVRLLVATGVLVLLTVAAISFTLLLRLLVPAHATPGWATTVSFGMIIIFLQVLFTALTAVLSLLNGRVQKLMLPLVDYRPYVSSREVLLDRRADLQA